jgi:hypothetical protein
LAYLFEAKGIQRWIMEGGRLRQISAASAILANACRSEGDDLLAPVLATAEFGPTFSRRAGGAFMLHFDAAEKPAFERFRALWRLVVMQIAPGLEFVESLGHGTGHLAARRAAHDASDPAHHRPAAGRENGVAGLLPLGHPLLALAGRTGRPEIRTKLAGEVEAVDIVAAAKRRAENALTKDVGDRFCEAGIARAAAWPNEMDRPEGGADRAGAVLFPFVREPYWIAVMHADISALGEFYAAIGEAVGRRAGETEAGERAALEIARGAAECIERSLTRAAAAATHKELHPKVKRETLDGVERLVMPARPILLGGDDITIVLRGDVALPFAKVFLETLETESEKILTDFAKRQGLAGDEGIAIPLTAAAGVAFGKAKQPFFRLAELAEGLCGHAKQAAKRVANGQRPASAIAFHRVTETALAASASEFLERMSLLDGRRLTAQPYKVGKLAAPGLISLTHLADLRANLAKPLEVGALRSIRSDLQRGLDDQSAAAWHRWCSLQAKRPESKDAFTKFKTALHAALGGPPDDMFFAAGSLATPLFDALEWEAVS